MSRRAIALAVSTLAALAIVWAYAIDAALPDRHAYKTVTLPSTAPVRPWTIVSVDSAELGYPGRSSSAPATLPPRLPPVVRAESDAHVAFKLAEPFDLRSNDRSTAWIWLLAAALLTALATIAAAFCGVAPGRQQPPRSSRFIAFSQARLSRVLATGATLEAHQLERSLQMDKHRIAITAAAALGVAAGSYGIASAASGNGNGTTTTTPSATQTAPSTTPSAPSGQPWGHQRSDETPLTGDALSKVTAIAKDKVPGGTVIRVETDADGNAAYEAHMVKSDGTPVTVYVDKDFNFVSVESGGPGGGPGGHAGFGGPPPQQSQQSQAQPQTSSFTA